MEILNRREQIGANSIPPEIVDASVVVKKTDYATASKAGVVKIGNNIVVSSGKISVPAASDETSGVVKVGNGLEVDENGFLNASGGGGGTEVIYSGDGSTVTFTLPDGRNLTDYKLLAIIGKAGSSYCAGFTPTAVLSSKADTYITCWYNGNNNLTAKVRTTSIVVATQAGGMAVVEVIGIL